MLGLEVSPRMHAGVRFCSLPVAMGRDSRSAVLLVRLFYREKQVSDIVIPQTPKILKVRVVESWFTYFLTKRSASQAPKRTMDLSLTVTVTAGSYLPRYCGKYYALCLWGLGFRKCSSSVLLQYDSQLGQHRKSVLYFTVNVNNATVGNSQWPGAGSGFCQFWA